MCYQACQWSWIPGIANLGTHLWRAFPAPKTQMAPLLIWQAPQASWIKKEKKRGSLTYFTICAFPQVTVRKRTHLISYIPKQNDHGQKRKRYERKHLHSSPVVFTCTRTFNGCLARHSLLDPSDLRPPKNSLEWPPTSHRTANFLNTIGDYKQNMKMLPTEKNH